MFEDGLEPLYALKHVREDLVVRTVVTGYLLTFLDLIYVLNDVADRVGDLFREHDGRDKDHHTRNKGNDDYASCDHDFDLAAGIKGVFGDKTAVTAH